MEEIMKKKWLIVINKKTYLFLLSIPIALIYIVYDAVNTFAVNDPDIGSFISRIGIVLLLVLICIIFFVKFNTYSHWMNPNHRKPKD